MAANEENMRVRVPTPLKERWDKMLEARKISAQRAFVAMMDWIVDEDALTQAMIFGQVPEVDRAELSRIVLARLGKGGKKRAG